MTHPYYTQRPYIDENDADKDIARISGNPYHAEIKYKDFCFDLASVEMFEAGLLNNAEGNDTPHTILFLKGKPPISIMEPFEDFKEAFDAYSNKETYVYPLNAVK